MCASNQKQSKFSSWQDLCLYICMYKYAAHIYIFLSDKKTSVIFNLLLNCTPHLARLSCLRVLYWYTLYSVLLCITLLCFASNSCLILSTAIRDLVVCFFFHFHHCFFFFLFLLFWRCHDIFYSNTIFIFKAFD